MSDYNRPLTPSDVKEIIDDYLSQYLYVEIDHDLSYRMSTEFKISLYLKGKLIHTSSFDIDAATRNAIYGKI